MQLCISDVVTQLLKSFGRGTWTAAVFGGRRGICLVEGLDEIFYWVLAPRKATSVKRERGDTQERRHRLA